MVEAKHVNQPVVDDKKPKASEVDWFLLTDLRIDETYQHRPNVAAIAHLEKGFDPALSGFILINIRADGSHYIIDGQTRTAVYQKLRLRWIRAEVLRGLTEQQEALAYMIKCVNTQHVPVDFFKAELKAGVPEVVLLNKLLTQRQITLVRDGRSEHGARDGNGIACLAALRRLLRRDPTGILLGDTLDLINATWGYVEGALTQQNIESIFLLLSSYREKVIAKTFVEKFRDIPLRQLMVESQQLRLNTRPFGTVTNARRRKLEEIYNIGLTEARRLTPKQRGA